MIFHNKRGVTLWSRLFLLFEFNAQICAADTLVGQQLSTGAIHDHAARLKDVGAVCHGKGHLCILLDQQDGHARLCGCPG